MCASHPVSHTEEDARPPKERREPKKRNKPRNRVATRLAINEKKEMENTPVRTLAHYAH
jgi:hypothetical protein